MLTVAQSRAVARNGCACASWAWSPEQLAQGPVTCASTGRLHHASCRNTYVREWRRGVLALVQRELANNVNNNPGGNL